MSIHPGLSGQKFMPEALGRISELRERLPEDVLVQVDGGIHRENIAQVHEAGANLLVCGAAIFWGHDPRAAYEALVAALASPARSS